MPALLGARRGLRAQSLRFRPTLITVIVLAVLTSMASRGLEGSVVFGRGALPFDQGPDGIVVTADEPQPWWFLSLVMLWPAVYVLATTTWQRWREKSVLA